MDRKQQFSIWYVLAVFFPLGYTIQRPTEDRYLMTRDELEGKMAVLLGGRGSEHLVFGHLSTGAADDLSKASEIARAMVTRYGMDDTLGHAAYETQRQSLLGPLPPGLTGREFSEETAREIDCAVRDLVVGAFDRALALLEGHRDVLETSARELLAHETLDEPELATLRDRVAAPATPP